MQTPTCSSEISQTKRSPKGIFWERGGGRNKGPLRYICKLWARYDFSRSVWEFVSNLSSTDCVCVSQCKELRGDLWWWVEGRYVVDTRDKSLFCSLFGWASPAEVGFWGQYFFSRVPKEDFCKYLLVFTWHLQSFMSIWSHPGMLTGNKHKSGHELSWCGYSF